MKKLSVANPELTYAQRKELMAGFVPENVQSEAEIAQYFEGGEQEVAAFIQQVRDQFCSRQIYDWA
jgi:hypothetical protein